METPKKRLARPIQPNYHQFQPLQVLDSDLDARFSSSSRIYVVQQLSSSRNFNHAVGHIGQHTTEIGLSQVYSWRVDTAACGDSLYIHNRHAIIWETFDDHPSRGAQDGNMAINDEESKTYPRWNFRGGSNATKRADFGYPTSTKVSYHQGLTISVDTEIIHMANAAWWVLYQVPGTSQYSGNDAPVTAGPSLALVTNCKHDKHDFRALPRKTDGSFRYPPRETRRERKAKQEYRM